MKTLLLLRHAKSSWKDPERPDHDRPLNKRGKQNAPRMGALIAELRLVPDLIVSSTARRARKTAKHAARSCGYEKKIERLESLYLADVPQQLDVLRSLPGEAGRVLLVGHNPGLEELLARLTASREHLSTGTLARIELPIDAWSDLTGEVRGQLAGLWRPKDLQRPPGAEGA